jgi:hypothetical protein
MKGNRLANIIIGKFNRGCSAGGSHLITNITLADPITGMRWFIDALPMFPGYIGIIV